MTVIKINAITVPADSGDELAHRFAARAGRSTARRASRVRAAEAHRRAHPVARRHPLARRGVVRRLGLASRLRPRPRRRRQARGARRAGLDRRASCGPTRSPAAPPAPDQDWAARRARLSSLPRGLRSRSSTRRIWRGHLKRDSRCSHQAWSSSTTGARRGRPGPPGPPAARRGRVGQADAGHVGDRRVGDQDLLHLGRVHVDAAGHHHVGEAVGDVDPAVGVDPPDLAEGEHAGATWAAAVRSGSSW